jgi:solute carrier family 8 (sodium/calcium exchanger)
LLINWKLLFSIIPPIKWGGGKYAFIVALTLIGVITGIVGEIAELIGCVLSLNP